MAQIQPVAFVRTLLITTGCLHHHTRFSVVKACTSVSKSHTLYNYPGGSTLLRVVLVVHFLLFCVLQNAVKAGLSDMTEMGLMGDLQD